MAQQPQQLLRPPRLPSAPPVAAATARTDQVLAALERMPREGLSPTDLGPLERYVHRRLQEAQAPGEIPALLDAALCSLLLPPGPIDPGTNPMALVSEAAEAASGGSTSACGYIFKTGDIAWVCRTCQADDTCVLCQECFAASDHEGHEGALPLCSRARGVAQGIIQRAPHTRALLPRAHTTPPSL